MKKLLIFSLLLLFARIGVAQNDYVKVVNAFIKAVQNSDKEAIASTVNFPFRMTAPVPYIQNKNEFIRRYNEVFPAGLVQKIIRSHASKHWGPVGSKGIMFLNGDVWIDVDGSLMAVNYKLPIVRNEKPVKKKSIIPNVNVSSEFLIKEGCAGKFKLSYDAPSLSPTKEYKVTKIKEVVSEEGYDCTYTYYFVNDYKEDLLKISAEKKEIIVLSGKYKTSKGICVGSTIEEFINVYPDYKIWYTYISDMCVIQTKTGNIQFILNKDDLKIDPPCNGEIDYLKKLDFEANSKIIRVRIF